MLAVLAVRWVPKVALTVPDDYLLDLDRLAVTAWSARDVGDARTSEVAIRGDDIAGAAARASRTVTAAAAAIAAVSGAAAGLLLRSATVPLDRLGAQVLVAAAGGVLLLAARSHRAAAARQLLRIGGGACLVALAVQVLSTTTAQTRAMVAVGAVLLALVLLLVAVLVGRGWRSDRWSHYADVAEVVCGVGAIGATVVATGLFRFLWTTTG